MAVDHAVVGWSIIQERGKTPTAGPMFLDVDERVCRAAPGRWRQQVWGHSVHCWCGFKIAGLNWADGEKGWIVLRRIEDKFVRQEPSCWMGGVMGRESEIVL